MTTDIFIKTCKHDAAYHAFCIKSIDKYCSGFRDTMVVDNEHPRGYLQQQVVKLHADIHTDADYILVTDSDTLFTEPVTPESFMRNGLPIWHVTPWNDEMLSHPGTHTWYDVMGQFFNEVPPLEFMRRQPFFLPGWILRELRSFCIVKHGIPIDEYIYSKGVFSEFNIIGFYAWLFHRDAFYWMDTTVELPPAKTRQFWSHDPIAKNLQEIQQILA